MTTHRWGDERVAVRLGAFMICALVAIAALASTASARRSHARPQLSWTIAHSASEEQPIPFSWSGRRLGRNHQLVVQRPVGTAHVWKTIMRLPANRGSGELPGMALGRYRLRLADFVWVHRHYWRGVRRYHRTFLRLVAKRAVGIGVFGQVPFTTLFRTSDGESYGERPGTYTTPSASFPYVSWFEPGEFDSPTTAFTVEHNHCVAVHVDFVPSYPGLAAHYNPSTVSGTTTIVQETRDPVSAEAPYDGIGSVEAAVVPGQSWSVNVSYKGEFEPLMYLNGYAVCDSTESFFS